MYDGVLVVAVRVAVDETVDEAVLVAVVVNPKHRSNPVGHRRSGSFSKAAHTATVAIPENLQGPAVDDRQSEHSVSAVVAVEVAVVVPVDVSDVDALLVTVVIALDEADDVTLLLGVDEPVVVPDEVAVVLGVVVADVVALFAVVVDVAVDDPVDVPLVDAVEVAVDDGVDVGEVRSQPSKLPSLWALTAALSVVTVARQSARAMNNRLSVEQEKSWAAGVTENSVTAVLRADASVEQLVDDPLPRRTSATPLTVRHSAIESVYPAKQDAPKLSRNSTWLEQSEASET